MPQNVPSTSYDANNRQLTFGDKTLAYDDNGNLQTITDSNGTTIYSWNARNQLVRISGPNVSASFLYDGVGRREKKTINNNLTEFLYDGVNPVQESSGATVLANILTGLQVDELFTHSDVGAGATTSLLTDHLRSILALTDAAGLVQTEYTYEPFGKTTATGSSNINSFQYTGRENDGTGLYYYRARYYHPTLQRFIGEDPMGFAGRDYNLFAYVKNNPLTKRDPLGLAPCGDDKDCLRKFSECMAHASANEIRCMAFVAAGAATCVAGAGLACITAGPGYAACLAVFSAQCVTAAAYGFELCTTYFLAEVIQCYRDYDACMKG